VRNLEASEMLALVACALEALPGDARPLELSFTGEGEPLLNWRNVAKTVDSCRRLDARFDRVRYSCSGVGALALLPRTHGAGLPVRLQVSLHSARQAARDHLVPRSTPLIDLEAALRQHQALFQRIELNVVLQDGINDSDADLQALGTWGDESWPILLNPLLSDGQERVAARTSDFENALRAAGRQVVRYERVASAISRGGLYRRLTASPRPESVRL
jgi:adenine C2-methylase RlmN of 23S rRNA A2503 and tRNA A37